MEELKNALTLVNIYTCLVQKHGLIKYEGLLERWQKTTEKLQQRTGR